MDHLAGEMYYVSMRFFCYLAGKFDKSGSVWKFELYCLPKWKIVFITRTLLLC